jgi:uridine kinase
MAYVVAVTGISGAGKSSVIKRSIELLGGGAAALHFDDYRDSSEYPGDLKAWAERGGDVDEWKTPRLAEDLRRMRADSPATVLFVEEPFGKMRREMAGLIDLAIHIDVPPDVLLARRLLRRIAEERADAGLTEKLGRDLNYHLTTGRHIDRLASDAIMNAADVVVDGTKSIDEIAADVAGAIRQRG